MDVVGHAEEAHPQSTNEQQFLEALQQTFFLFRAQESEDNTAMYAKKNDRHRNGKHRPTPDLKINHCPGH